MKKFKIPEPILPTESEMKSIANNWWQHHVGVNFGDWNEALRKNSFEYRICSISRELIEETIAIFDNGSKGIDALIEKYEIIIRPVLKELKCEDFFFFKLISRSPKDSLADFNNHGKPKSLDSISGAVHAMLNSMRCFEDLVLLRYLDNSSIIIRPYIEFEPYEEWRVYIKDKKIVGVSQYYYQSEFPELTTEAVISTDIEIRKMINNIVIPNMTLSDYIADIIVGRDGRPTVVLETNPYGLSDPCLFGNYNSFDGTTIWNNGGKIDKL